MEVASKIAGRPPSSARGAGRRTQPAYIEDERRIYGDRRKRDDPGEVRIPVPCARKPLTKLGIPRGPQPKNTLSESYTSRPLDKSPFPQLKNPMSNSNIAIVVSRGDNVPRTKADLEDYGNEGPVRKKRKTATIQQDQCSQATGSDDIDELSLQQELMPSLARESHKEHKHRIDRSQGNERPKHYFGAEEFRNVENTMNSNPNRKNRGRGRHRRSPAENRDDFQWPFYSRPDVSSAMNPIDISVDEQLGQPLDLSYATSESRCETDQDRIQYSAPRNALGSLSVRDTGTTSHHWDPTIRSSMTQRKPLAEIGTSQTQDEVETQEYRLNENSRAANGRQRSGDFASSPDVLNGVTTVGIASCQDSLSKQSPSSGRGSPKNDGVEGLPPSNIPRTMFDTANGKRRLLGPKRHNPDAPEAVAPWGLSLAAVTAGGYTRRSQSLGLQYRPPIDSYDVIDSGHNLGSQNSNFRINPEKLRKLHWSKDDGRIRLESARTKGTEATLDIELCNAKDTKLLIEKLQERHHHFKIQSEDGDKMRRMFENRLSEAKAQRTVRVSILDVAVDEGEEVGLLEKRKARRDESSDSKGFKEMSHKRRRLEPSTVDQMKGDVQNVGVVRFPWENPQDTQHIPIKKHYDQHRDRSKRDGTANKDQNLRSDGATGVSGSSLEPRKERQTTYATRSSTENAPIGAKTSVFIPEEDTLKHCSKNNMGKPWTKPLTYPKTGKKKALVEWADLDRLDEAEYFNDTLIEFYLRYLQHQLERQSPAWAKKIYFFNSFFFKNLTHKGKGQRSSNYELVMNWTRGVDIFTYDYIVVPINESFHWYVVVICNLPALNRYQASPDNDLATRPGNEGRSNSSSAPSPCPEEAQSPSEQDTRNSFAELSLEKRNGETAKGGAEARPGAVDTAADDQEMLDTQLNGDIAKAEKPKGGDVWKVSTGAKDIALQVDLVSQGSPPSKKGKRKSIPPMKRLDPGQPAIVTFDSLTGTHPGTVRIIKDYLLAEAKRKRNMTFDEKEIKGMTAVGIPKQDNFCDCGPFLLGYMAAFLNNPSVFMSKALQKQFHAENDWPFFDPTKLRASIRELLFELYREQEDERRDSAKKIGKHVSRNPDSSPPRSTTLEIGETKPQAEADWEMAEKPSIPSSPQAAGTKSQKPPRHSSPIPTACSTALSTTLPVDAPSPTTFSKSPIASPKSPNEVPPVEKHHSILVVDSQSQPQSVRASLSPLKLPSTIQDSQPIDSFDELHTDIPTTPPIYNNAECRKLASSPEETEDIGSRIGGPEMTEILGSNPRPVTQSAGRNERSDEVVELD